jgi:hypothetical protein
MIGESLAIAKRIVILILAVVLIGFGGLQLMRGRDQSVALPRLINLYGVQGPLISREPVYREVPAESVAEAPSKLSWTTPEAVAEVRAQPRLIPNELIDSEIDALAAAAPKITTKAPPPPAPNYEKYTELEDLLRR